METYRKRTQSISGFENITTKEAEDVINTIVELNRLRGNWTFVVILGC